ncbi:MAG TPA: TonB-dependent receptor [Acidobacteriaceae bacterium]|jgi:iron complex outermembrane receptor protein|nr:TonB-dependent receptor [Acidobacteriaceae bacterium]
MTVLRFLRPARLAFYAAALSVPAIVIAGVSPIHAQTVSSTGALTGTVLDPRGAALPGANVSLKNEATGATQKLTSDGQGRYTFSNLAAGKYTLQVDDQGFTIVHRTIQVADGQSADVPVTLALANVSAEVTVEAAEVKSVAAALAPMDALLSETSARTEITAAMIQNFMPPTADYGEAVQLAPGTFTTNSNGVGLGQSNTYFRGFADGNYDIDFDGLPFYDTNTPSHHSWAFFPSQFLGGIDFDRSPGTASTIGPTPFGGSIHLLSKDFSPVRNIRGGISYGSFNTKLFDGEFDSGSFGPSGRLNVNVDVHNLTSDGYQTWNHQKRNAGDIKVGYKVSDKTTITGFSGVIYLDANTPNFNATRCQMYGAQTGYTCTGANAFYAGSGINFLLTDNSDPVNYLDNQYNTYHVPTDFEYVGVHSELGKGVTIDVKPYTYSYNNSELYSNATPITESTTVNGSKTWNGIAVAPCNVQVVKKGVGALPCGVDKYNSYRKYGESGSVSQVSKFGILRTGLWYEWAATDRHQYPADPLNKWQRQPLPNFAEQFWTNSHQPFVEYQFNVTPKLKITPGTKFAYYVVDTKQYADNGKTIGCLQATCSAGSDPTKFITNGGSYTAWLPSIDANYRLRTNWSVYGQVATGSVVPPSKVFDFNQGVNGVPVKTAPKQQRSTTYQFGTVVKLNRATLDADFYHTRFQNSYSSTLDSTGEPVYFLQPSSITKGFEAQSNIYITHGLSAYLNATVGRAEYVGNLYVACSGTAGTGCTSTTPLLTIAAPGGLWVQNTPSDTESEGVTYQRHGWDAGFFSKRVGTMYQDNGQYHNQAAINPFSVSNLFLNYTIRNGSHFNQTKFRFSINNLANSHNITSDTITGTALTQNIAANGTAYLDPFNTSGQTPIAGGDNVGVLSARSYVMSVTFGFGPKR